MTTPPAARGPLLLHSSLDSPLTRVLLRALVFLSLVESVFYRLLPAPRPSIAADTLRRMHASLNRAGELTFHLAFFLALGVLFLFAWRAVRYGVWPSGLNGFLSVCLVCLATLGLSVATRESGPGLAMAFTLLSLLMVLLVSMHAFAAWSTPPWARGLAVAYSGAVLCSAAATCSGFASRLGFAGPGGAVVSWLSGRQEELVSGGVLLVAASGVLAFLAFSEPGKGRPSRSLWLSALPGGAAAAAFSAAALLLPASLAPLGPDPGLARVALLASTIFLGSLSAMLNLADVSARMRGQGLLLLLAAGFPLGIAQQNLLAVLGAVLVFSPGRPQSAAEAIRSEAPLEGLPSVSK